MFHCVSVCVCVYGKIYLPELKQEAETEADAETEAGAGAGTGAASADAAAPQAAVLAVKFIWLVMRFNCLSLG